MIFHDVQQNTEEWLALRKGKFTASTFGSLFMAKTTAGYQNAIYKVCYERLTGESPESFGNDWMERGHILESEAREEYELLTFNKVSNGGFCELNEWIGCSPDGFVKPGGILEIKSPKYSTLMSYTLSGELPREYKYQVHGQLWITESEFCDFFVYHPKLKPMLLWVNRDEKIIKELEDALVSAINEAKQKLTILNKKGLTNG